jgi:CRP/FNR family transcriptional regulator, cyclic AMP receptor protein
MSDSIIRIPPKGPARRSTQLESVSQYAYRVFLQVGHRKKFRNGQIVLSSGELFPFALLVISGRLRVVTATADGEEHLIRWLEPGEITGLGSVIVDYPFPADMVATGGTELLLIDRQKLIDLIKTDGEIALAIVRVLSLRIIELVDIISDDGLPNLQHKVLAALERLAIYHGIPVKDGIELRINQGDIAQIVAASRQRVNMQLQRLQDRQLIRLGYRSITLLKR